MPPTYYLQPPTKHVRFEDDVPKDPRPRHHHHAHPQPVKTIYIYDDDEPIRRRGNHRHRHYHHEVHHYTRPGPTTKYIPPPLPKCRDCGLDFKSRSDLDRHRLRNPRHCPQHLTCFSDWARHCFDVDHIKCPRSSCRDLRPFDNRHKCLEHLRAWHAS